jgi:aminoglycoside phosphotransferase (APT) family kinase protein
MGLPHGYTNRTERIGPGLVRKRYLGPERHESWRRERLCLSTLAGLLPVPAIVEEDPGAPALVLEERPGRPGQQLIDEGFGAAVMGLVGATLRAVQAVPGEALAELGGRGAVLVHGDFGPHNMLFDLEAEQPVSGLVDWEFAHFGDPIEDLAWAEWTVRMHHPAHAAATEHLLEHAGSTASWPERRAAMVRRCAELVDQAAARGGTDDAERWRRRLAVTEEWSSSHR